MKEFFFGELNFPGWGQLLTNLLVWALFVFLIIWILKLAINKFRKPNLKYRNEKFYMVRDLFLQITKMESLIAFMIVFAIYAGFWEWVVRLENYDWTNWETYLAALPQIMTFTIVVVIFFVKLFKFKNAYK